jgi:hypothetical protein
VFTVLENESPVAVCDSVLEARDFIEDRANELYQMQLDPNTDDVQQFDGVVWHSDRFVAELNNDYPHISCVWEIVEDVA